MKRGGTQKARILLLWGATVVVIAAAFFFPRFGQPPAYHVFADTRTFSGIPSFLNVISNGGFLIVGAIGLCLAIFRPNVFFFERSRERLPYIVLFAGIVLTSFGSSWYHLAPSNESLMWDRLPMTIIFAAFLSITITERIGVNAGLISILPFTLAGISTVLYWYGSELGGNGDLRPYVLMQFYPVIAIPLAMALFPPRYTRAGHFLFVIVLYGLSRIPEVYDAAIYARLGGLGGHTVKHIVAAIALLPLFAMLHYRERK